MMSPDLLYLAYAVSWPPVSNNSRDSCRWTHTSPGGTVVQIDFGILN